MSRNALNLQVQGRSLYDLLVIGGGVNGVSIARDAAGRGLSVLLVEKDDLASHTSSASSKLAHGGLRYLARGDLRLVRESLHERTSLLRNAPHLCRPLRFVLPTQKIAYPSFFVRAGLWVYDHLGGSTGLPHAFGLDLKTADEGRPLWPSCDHSFSYMDAWVEDMRLVVSTARDAQLRGANIRTRTRFVGASAIPDGWSVRLLSSSAQGGTEEVLARCLVNTAGPWVADVHKDLDHTAPTPLKLVQGSHLVVPRLYHGDWAYVLTGDDKRVVFALPYENDFTLIGTTDTAVASPHITPNCTPEEQAYLLKRIADYFKQRIDPSMIVQTYSGVRALYDDGRSQAQDLTRDYKFVWQTSPASVLHVYGGKITTARALAERAVSELADKTKLFPALKTQKAWTATTPLIGGDLGEPLSSFEAHCAARWPWLPSSLCQRYVRQYGTQIDSLLEGAVGLSSLGEEVLPSLFEREIDWLLRHEFAQTAEDIVWRRTRLGLRFSPAQIEDLADRL